MNIILMFILVLLSIVNVYASDELCPCWRDEIPISWLIQPPVTMEEIIQKEQNTCISLVTALNSLLERDGMELENLEENCPAVSPSKLEKELFDVVVKSSDKIYFFSSPTNCGKAWAGVSGYALVRNDQVIAHYITTKG